MPRVGRRRREAEMPVERDGLVVLCMHGERAHVGAPFLRKDRAVVNRAS